MNITRDMVMAALGAFYANANEKLRSERMAEALRAAFAVKDILQETFPTRNYRSGANGMHEGDRVVYTLTGSHGVAGEFLQDGDAGVDFDSGAHGTVKWQHLVPETE